MAVKINYFNGMTKAIFKRLLKWEFHEKKKIQQGASALVRMDVSSKGAKIILDDRLVSDEEIDKFMEYWIGKERGHLVSLDFYRPAYDQSSK